jgi:hypothetical protein
MFLHSLGERAEDDAQLAQLLAKGGGDGDTVEDRVDGYTGEELLFLEGNPQLLVRPQQFRVDLVQALRSLLVRFGRRVVDDRLIIDRRVLDEGPIRLLHRRPLSEGLETPFEHELGLVFLGGDGADDLLVEPRSKGLRVDLGDEPPFVFTIGELLYRL